MEFMNLMRELNLHSYTVRVSNTGEGSTWIMTIRTPGDLTHPPKIQQANSLTDFIPLMRSILDVSGAV